MPTFAYKAKDAQGSVVGGRLEAATRRAALQKLAARRIRPLSIAEAAEGDEGASLRADGGSAARRFGLAALLQALRPAGARREAPAKRKHALPFLQALKELLNCGIQPGDALRLLATRLSDPRQKALAAGLWDDLRQGRSLSEGLRARPEVFEESAVNLVEAGEATGHLKRVLERIVADMEERKRVRDQLAAAMAYPLFLMFVCAAVVLLFLFVLLPRIQGLLDSLGSKLPASTRLLIGLSEWTLQYGWLIGLALVGAAVGVASWRKTEKGRVAFDALVLRLPGLGRFLRDSQILQFAQSLSLLLENGITMVQALAMAERSLSNRAMRERFREARGKVVEGASLSGALKSAGYVDPLTLDIFTVGENTGNLVPGLKQMARQYTEAIDKHVKSFLGVLSVGVLLLAFAFVFLIAYGIISSVFQLSSSLSAA